MASAPDLVTVAKLYRDALKVATMLSFQQGNNKKPLMDMVRQSFRSNAHLTDAAEIKDAKQRAITALSNYYTAKAYDMAVEEREENVEQAKQDARKAAKVRRTK